jgi:hypothetical protein
MPLEMLIGPNDVPGFKHTTLPALAEASAPLTAPADETVVAHDTFGSAATPTSAPDGGGAGVVVVLEVVVEELLELDVVGVIVLVTVVVVVGTVNVFVTQCFVTF